MMDTAGARAEIWASIGRGQDAVAALDALDALDLAAVDDPWVLRLIAGPPMELLRSLGGACGFASKD